MDAVSEVKSRLSIEDVISEYVTLKRTGRNFKGLSPFTSEKTPSFVVSPEKQIWHDFSSGRGGDLFTFIESVEGLDFKGALELLARKAGVDLEQYKTKSAASQIDKRRLYSAIDSAVNFYQRQLLANQNALDYITKKRGFSRQTIIDFRLGYSPDSPKSLITFLAKKGYSDKELKLAGLISQRSNGSYDMFRGRIMVPLCDSTGQAIGFTARLLDKNDKAPKYINTPATPLYDKSRQLYGLHLAKETIRKKGFSVIAEGNLDVIASHQAGVKNVIASAGTALTEQQLKVLARFSDDVRLAFDQDRAGLEATERAIPIASKVGVNLKIITLPGGKDPDELIKRGIKLWESAIDNAEYAVDWLISLYQKNLDLTSAQGKMKFSDVVIEVIKKLDDPVEQDHYISVCSNISGVDPSALRKKLDQNASKQSIKLRYVKPAEKTKIFNKELNRAVDRLLCLALMVPATRKSLETVMTEMMTTEKQIEILKFLKENPDFDGKGDSISKLKNIAQDAKILVLQFEELYSSVDQLELRYEAERLRAKIIEYFVKERKTKLSGDLRENDESKHQEILAEVKKLDQLLKTIKDI